MIMRASAAPIRSWPDGKILPSLKTLARFKGKPPGSTGARPSSQWMPRTDRTIRGSLAGDARRWMLLASFRLKSGKQVANQNFVFAPLSA